MHILVVDDDRTLSDLLAFTLRRAGYDIHLAFDAPGALTAFQQMAIDLIVLDVNMPGKPGLKDGFDVCQAIRQSSDVPIILLTVRDDEEDVVKGLKLGADDYILKPFSPRELVARVETVLRRAASGKAKVDAPYLFGEISFDPHLRTFCRQGTDPVSLTNLEAQLLEVLMLNRGQILPAELLINQIWGPGGGSQEMLRQLIRRLRVKVEIDPESPELIQNLPGIGYGFGL
jgi:DNA-binding response OmpR family regulator